MKKDDIIYLDNAATTWPKPEPVIKALSDFYLTHSGSSGRAGHKLAVNTSRMMFDTRELLSGLFNMPDSERIIFTINATFAVNMVLNTVAKKGSHIICSGMEHNAVFRPLRHLEETGIIELTIVESKPGGLIDTEALEKSFKANTAALIMTHASNLNGTVMPIRQAGALCRKHHIPFIVDAAQTAGFLPIDARADNIDVLVFSGHKKLYGPAGTGGLCFSQSIDIEPFIRGGTGSKSDSFKQPGFYPDRLESGTPNTPGIAALNAALRFAETLNKNDIRNFQTHLTDRLTNALESMDEVELYPPSDKGNHIPVIAFNIKNMMCSSVAEILDKEYGIFVRAGLHCAPLAHRTAGSPRTGAVRISTGIFNNEKDIELTINAIKTIVKENK